MKAHVLVLAMSLLTVARAFAQEDKPAARWPTAEASAAIRAGTLKIELTPAEQAIETFGAVNIQIRLLNSGWADIRMPEWIALMGAEVVPADGIGQTYRWERKVTPSDLSLKYVSKPGVDPGQTYTTVWFATDKLAGLPAGVERLPAGKYRWRLVVAGDPDLVSNWVDITVKPPAMPAGAPAPRPGGRVLLVSIDRISPRPDGSVEAPFTHLRDAMAAAKAGDTVFCPGGRAYHVTDPFTVPDGVRLVGRGAAHSVIFVGAGANTPTNEPLIRLCGKSRVEGVTLAGDGYSGNGALVRVEGADARPELFQCSLVPGESSFATVACSDGAAPALRNCIIISPVGEYGVFAREGCNPTLEFCTIISRGFGVGMMDRSMPVIRRCIITGRCPGVISDWGDGELALAQSLIWCPTTAGNYRDPVITWTMRETGGMIITPLPEILRQKGMAAFDPQFAGTGGVAEYFTPKAGSGAAEYGAFAGEGGKWPVKAGERATDQLPEMSKYLPSR